MWMLLVAGLAGYALQPPGAFHGDEPVARDGEAWLALAEPDGEHAALVATQLRLRAVHDAVLDADGQRTGLEVTSAGNEAATMFLRGAALAPGPIRSAVVSAGPPDRPLHYTLRFDGRDYGIHTRCTPAGHIEGQPQFRCMLRFEGAGRGQTLAELPGYSPSGGTDIRLGDDGMAGLRYAGDLDRDGRLDLIFDLSDHYNVSRPTLFLSSPAGSGDLVRLVAQFQSVGC